MSRTGVLIIAPTADLHAQVVARRVAELGGSAVVLDAADYPSRWRLDVGATSDRLLPAVLRCDDIVLAEDDLSGIWWRRPGAHVVEAAVRETNMRNFALLESRAAFDGWLHCMADRMINPIGADRTASHKLLQLKCAAEVGMEIPSTLVTNDSDSLRSFCAEVESQVVFKPFTGSSWSLLPTRRLTEVERTEVEAVGYSPVIFQEEITKSADVRITVVDSEVFPVLIRSDGPRMPLDWRIDPGCAYAAHEIPDVLHEQIMAYMQRLALRFAAFDFALTQDGRYVFFEANTGGQWIFAEILAGQEISRAFARALLRGSTGPAPSSSVRSRS